MSALRREEETLSHPWGEIAICRLRHADNDPSRPWLVFLHEALGSIAMWKDIPEQLAGSTGLNALVYDRLGHGASGPLPPQLAGGDYLAHESFSILPFVLDQAGIEQAILIGHSDGGTIALLGATQLDDRVSAIVTEAAHVFVEPETLDGVAATTTAADVDQLKARVSRYHQQSIEPIFQRWPTIWLSEPFRHWSMEHDLAKIHCPVLVIQGSDDEFGTEKQVTAIANGCSGSTETLLIEGCGHVPHFQAHEVWMEKVTAFVHAGMGGEW